MLATPPMVDWAECPVYRRALRGSSGAIRPMSLFQFGFRLWIHACWPSSLRRSECNLVVWIHACWQSSLRRFDCNPKTSTDPASWLCCLRP